MSKNIKIHEVGFRDGLQNEKVVIPTELKIRWIESILNSNVDIIQLGSFVNKEKVPQMADTDILFKHFKSNDYNVLFSALALNEKGADMAVESGADVICLGASASNTHSLKNTGMNTSDAVSRIINIARRLTNEGKKVQVSVQSAFGCGFEGSISEEHVLNIAKKYIENGLINISLADTAGHAYPEQVTRLFSAIKSFDENTVLTSHFHNTYGLGIANCYAAMNAGAEYFETAFGGLGGCPFTKVAAGNVSTEDFVHSLNRNNVRKDIKLESFFELSKECSDFLEKTMQSYVLNVGQISY